MDELTPGAFLPGSLCPSLAHSCSLLVVGMTTHSGGAEPRRSRRTRRVAHLPEGTRARGADAAVLRHLATQQVPLALGHPFRHAHLVCVSFALYGAAGSVIRTLSSLSCVLIPVPDNAFVIPVRYLHCISYGSVVAVGGGAQLIWAWNDTIRPRSSRSRLGTPLPSTRRLRSRSSSASSTRSSSQTLCVVSM